MANIQTPQARNSATFKAGPVDGSLSIPQLLDFNYKQNPNHPMLVYDDEDGKIVTITVSQYVTCVHQAAKSVIEVARKLELPERQKPIVIGILALCDSISYAMMSNAITRAGHTPFLISPRNSIRGLVNLLKVTNTSFLYVSGEPIQEIVAKANSVLESQSLPPILTFQMPSFAQFQATSAGATLLPPMTRPLDDTTAVILHSSGTTSDLVKPIFLSHKTYSQWGATPYFGEMDICDEVMACHSIPMFHGMGTVVICIAATSGLILSFLRPASPLLLPTPANVVSGALATKSTILFCVPAQLEAWSKTEEGMHLLKSMKLVNYGGAPLAKSVGNRLIQEGVNLTQYYGAIETGCLTPFLPLKHYGVDWEYFKLSVHCRPILKPLPDIGNNIYELSLIDIPTHTPCFINTSIDGERAYRLDDLLERHPTKPGFWKVYGRSDDQISLSSGLKINPSPTENMVTKHPDIRFAVVFGQNRLQSGILLELQPTVTLDYSNPAALETMREKIWPQIEEVNQDNPAHAAIIKALIVFAVPDKPFDLTAKLQPRRPVVLKTYEKEIEAAYAALSVTV